MFLKKATYYGIARHADTGRIWRLTYALACIVVVILCQTLILTSFRQYQSKVLLKSAEKAIDANNFSPAESDAGRAARLSPFDGYAQFQHGTSVYLQGRFTEAVPLFLKSIAVLPHSFNAVRLLGFSYYGMKEYEEAARFLARYLKLNPSPVVTPDLVFRMAGLSHLRIGSLADSAYLLMRAGTSNEDKGELMRVRSMIAVLMNLPYTADYSYRTFRYIKPNAAFRPVELVSNAMSADKMVGAIEFLEMTRIANPEDASTARALAAAYSRAGKTHQAIQLLEEVMSASPPDPELHLFLGDLHYTLKQYDKAFRQYDEHLRLVPDSKFRQDILQKKATSHE